MNKLNFLLPIVLLSLCLHPVFSQEPDLTQYNVVWTSQSQNSSESMPCGGGDIGLNVWVENGEILFYLSRSGAFDENNVFPKFGRVRVKLTPNPFDGGDFQAGTETEGRICRDFRKERGPEFRCENLGRCFSSGSAC